MADEQRVSQGGVTVAAELAAQTERISQGGVTVAATLLADDRMQQVSQGGVTVAACVIPPAPTSLSAVKGTGNAVTLTWTDNTGGLLAYTIERSTSGGAYTVIATTAAGATTYSDTPVLYDTLYAYRIRAYGDYPTDMFCGWSAYSGIASVTLTGPPLCTVIYTLEIDWGAGWVDETGNLNHASIRRGTSSPLARVATVGRASFVLANHAQTYSPPLHATVIPRVPVRFTMEYDGVSVVQFVGFIDSIRPTPDLCGTRKLVELDCVDSTAFLDLFEGDIPLQVAAYADDVIDAVIDAVYAFPLVPPATSYDVGVNLFPTSADRWTHGPLGGLTSTMNARALQRTAASDKIQDACVSDWGSFYVAKDGTLTFINRHHISTDTTTELTLDNAMIAMEYQKATDSVLNYIEVTCYPRAVGSVYEIVGRVSQNGAPMIDSGPGTAQVFEIDFRDPANNAIAIGALDPLLPVATTDYAATSDEAGLGSDETANVAVAMVDYGDRAEVTLTNGAAYPVYIQKLQIRGYAVRAREPGTAIAQNAASIITNGKRKLSINAPLMNSLHEAQALADYLLDYYKDPLDEIPSVTFSAHTDATLMSAARDIELFDRVMLSEGQTGVSAKAFYVYSITHDISDEYHHDVTLGLLVAYDIGGDPARWDYAHWDGPEVWVY
jgi:hypothetical protein